MRGMRTMVAALLATWMLVGVVVEALAPLAVSERPSFAELSDLRGRSRNIAIVTTAALPWMTGTSVNPLLRAVYLERMKEKHQVTLVVPWICEKDQACIYPGGVVFKEQEGQVVWIRNWVKQHLDFKTNIEIKFYEAQYRPEFGSIFPLSDVTLSVPVLERDVAFLEEPEHLTWYHQGNKWCDMFNFVVGIIHTNYFNYAVNDHQVPPPARLPRAIILSTLNTWCVRSYCHRIIKLSDAVPSYPYSITSNIHGVRSSFINIGASKINPSLFGSSRFSKGCYFIGKALWAKGYRQLMVQLKEHRRRTGVNLPIDVYGGGPDIDLIKAECEKEKMAWVFHGPIDHANPKLHDYKVMINPSLSDVVCTTTAEALAMGKFVVCADHPSNEFFKTFRNCFVYNTPAEFSLCLQHAMAADPAPLTENDRFRLSWEAATERLYDAAYTGSRRRSQHLVDQVLARVHNKIASWDIIRGWLPAPSSEPSGRSYSGWTRTWATPNGWENNEGKNLKGRLLLSASFLGIAACALIHDKVAEDVVKSAKENTRKVRDWRFQPPRMPRLPKLRLSIEAPSEEEVEE